MIKNIYIYQFVFAIKDLKEGNEGLIFIQRRETKGLFLIILFVK